MSKKLLVFYIIVSILFTSCVQKELMSKNQYNESIKNFLISKDGKKLVVIGEKYHYIFEMNKTLLEILTSRQKKDIKANFSSFSIDINNNIVGKYYLSYELYRPYSKEEDKLFNEDLLWLEKQKFEKVKYYSDMIKYKYGHKGKLKGVRYLASDINLPKNSFNQEYVIRIQEENYKYDKDTRDMLSPVAQVADGVLIIGGVVLVVALVVVTAGKALEGVGNFNGFGGGSRNYPVESKETLEDKEDESKTKE